MLRIVKSLIGQIFSTWIMPERSPQVCASFANLFRIHGDRHESIFIFPVWPVFCQNPSVSRSLLLERIIRARYIILPIKAFVHFLIFRRQLIILRGQLLPLLAAIA